MVNATGLASLPQLHSLTTLHLENVADFGREEIELIAEVKSLKNLSIINTNIKNGYAQHCGEQGYNVLLVLYKTA